MSVLPAAGCDAGDVDVSADLAAPCTPDELMAWVDDLERYPSWLAIVTSASPAAAVDGDAGPAWLVDLRGRLGPLARSKRLRKSISVIFRWRSTAKPPPLPISSIAAPNVAEMETDREAEIERALEPYIQILEICQFDDSAGGSYWWSTTAKKIQSEL